MLFGVARGDALGPRISVHDRGRAGDKQTTDDADQIFGPHRPLREAEARPPLPAGVEAEHDGGAGEQGERPAPQGADRTLRAAAHQGEALVERRDGLARRHPPRRAAPEQLGAEGDDEGGNAEIGDERAVKGADRRAERQRDDDRNDPDRRVFEAEIGRQDMDLRDADDRRDEADDRSDRQVDVAHHDDQHHAGRHDGDRRGLNRQVPEIARRQEQALAGLDQRCRC